MIWTNDPTRWLLAAALSGSYALVCLAPWLRARRKRLGLAAQQRQGTDDAASPQWIVAYASQTGNAEQLAQQTAATLRLAGIPVRLLELSGLSGADLQAAERA